MRKIVKKLNRKKLNKFMKGKETLQREPTDTASEGGQWWNTSGVHSLLIPPFYLRLLS